MRKPDQDDPYRLRAVLLPLELRLREVARQRGAQGEAGFLLLLTDEAALPEVAE
jgi:hypothetical protein